MDYAHILNQLPHATPFRFIDEVVSASESRIETRYTFKPDEFFYAGHYPANPVTPGAILCEAMVQGGLVALSLHINYLEGRLLQPDEILVLTSSQAEYFKPVLPGETITIIAEKIYYRFSKLKCRILAQNIAGEAVCEGIFAGMMVTSGKLQS
jgi:3-hydroxyacyl-[acyl-carrier-protein] dehydratase